VVNVDISAVCIGQMAARHHALVGMEWKVMDCCHLQFSDAAFGLVRALSLPHHQGMKRGPAS